jgi:hypothetical protein
MPAGAPRLLLEFANTHTPSQVTVFWDFEGKFTTLALVQRSVVSLKMLEI